jgi:hypothetical protein
VGRKASNVGWWERWRERLEASRGVQIRSAAETLTDDVRELPHLSVLLFLDIAIWMREQGWNRARDSGTMPT